VLLKEGEPPAEDRDWSRVTAKEFFKGYAERDAIYDAE
jgi:hypothetical protein